jgi:hypothetical protein
LVTYVLYERRFGVRTDGAVSLRELGLEEVDRVDYEPSGWLALRRTLCKREVSAGDVFLDYGSGKGRVVLQAALYPFRRVIGVELSSQLHEVAVTNVDRCLHRLRCQDIVLINSPAETYVVPDDVTVVFYFNPFGGDAFARTVQEIIASYDRNPRPIRLIYYNPQEEDRLLATGRIDQVRVTGVGARIYRVLPRPRDAERGESPCGTRAADPTPAQPAVPTVDPAAGRGHEAHLRHVVDARWGTAPFRGSPTESFGLN